MVRVGGCAGRSGSTVSGALARMTEALSVVVSLHMSASSLCDEGIARVPGAKNATKAAGKGRPAAWVAADVVRIEDGRLAEHWDVVEDEATRQASVSGLPMFGAAFPE